MYIVRIYAFKINCLSSPQFSSSGNPDNYITIKRIVYYTVDETL